MSRRAWLEQLGDATERLLDDLRERDAAALRPLRNDLEDLHTSVAGELDRERRDHPRLLVFLCGTTLMHGAALGRTREERVAQARTGTDPSLSDYAAYVPTEDSLEKLRSWSDQGAEILYLSCHRDPGKLAASASAVRTRGFPPGAVLGRAGDETYDDVVRRAAPDVLIEHDCPSPDAHDTAFDQLDPSLRGRVASIVVPEFGGLGHLPASLGTLVSRSA